MLFDTLGRPPDDFAAHVICARPVLVAFPHRRGNRGPASRAQTRPAYPAVMDVNFDQVAVLA